MSDRITVKGVAFECTIGTLPAERTSSQPVLVDLDLRLDLSSAGRTGRIAQTVPYDRVSDEVAAFVKFRRFRLIEAAAEEVAAMLIGLYPNLDAIWVTVHKPRALEHRGALASVTISRARADYPVRRETSRFGHVDVLLETTDAGLYLLQVAPGHEIPDHQHQRMRELEWLIAGRLWHGDREIPQQRPVTWQKGQVHGYRNRGEEWATIFCCDCPPFIRDDEIEVGGPSS